MTDLADAPHITCPICGEIIPTRDSLDAEAEPPWVEQLASELQRLSDRDAAQGAHITAAVYAYCIHRMRKHAQGQP